MKKNDTEKIDKARYAYWDEESGIGYFIIYDERGNLLTEEANEALKTLSELGLSKQLGKVIKTALLSVLEKQVIFYLSPELIRRMDVHIANHREEYPSKRRLFLTEAVVEKLAREEGK